MQDVWTWNRCESAKGTERRAVARNGGDEREFHFCVGSMLPEAGCECREMQHVRDLVLYTGSKC